jgi:hypothetical protein
MENTSNEDINQNFTNPSNYSQKLVTMKQQLPGILDDFKKAYLFYNVNPQNNEYAQNFQNIKGQLNDFNSQVFMLSNDLQSNSDDLNKKLFALNILIKNAKEKNKELKRKLGFVENKNTIADEMINNYSQMYDDGYLRNWGLLLSIIVAGFAISKVYSNKLNISFSK